VSAIVAHGQLDERTAPRPQSPETGGAAMAQHRVVADGQERRQEVPLAAKLGVTEGIDAASQRYQPAVPDPVVDATIAQADRLQLPAGDHAVLATREGPNRI
jgi:hypothetical protein